MGIKRRIFTGLTASALLVVCFAFENCSRSGHSLSINTGNNSAASASSTASTATPTPTPTADPTTLVWAHFLFPIAYYSGVSGCPGVLTTISPSSTACATKTCQLGVFSSGSPFGGTFIIESMAQACVAYDTVKKCIPATEVPAILLDPTKEAMNPTVVYPKTQPVLVLDTSTGLKICP